MGRQVRLATRARRQRVALSGSRSKRALVVPLVDRVVAQADPFRHGGGGEVDFSALAGVLAKGGYFIAIGVGTLLRLNYNANYGAVSFDLIEMVVANIERGNEEELLRELKQLKDNFHPTYEDTANYDELVRDFVDRMKTRDSKGG